MVHRIGFDMGGTKLLAVMFNEDYEAQGSTKKPTPANSNEKEILGLIEEMIQDLIKQSKVKESDIESIGIAVPGPVDHKEGKIINLTNVGLKDVYLKRKMEKKYRIPVGVENDVNAGIYGELVAGAAKGKKDVIGVYPGTGLGGGIIIDGKIYRGSTGQASEFGHMIVQIEGRLCGCGQRGCLEAMSSKTALAKELVQIAVAGKAPLLYENVGSDFKSIKSGAIKKSILAGETAVIEAVDSAAYYLGIGIANLINILNPEMVILGGGLMEKLEDHMFGNVIKSAKQHAMSGSVANVEFALSSLKDLSVALGAAALSFD